MFLFEGSSHKGSLTNHGENDKAKVGYYEEWLNALRFFNVKFREVGSDYEDSGEIFDGFVVCGADREN